MVSARVLIVDDESQNVEILLRLLERAGHAGVGADNAEAAATALSSGVFDAVLLDHVLPGATGMQSLDRLRGLTKAPIYVMSGYSDEETQRDALLLGAAGFLPKPVEVPALMALLTALPERP